MKKQLNITILLAGIMFILASCRAGDCGCPMSMVEEPADTDSVGVVFNDSDAIRIHPSAQAINSNEFHPHYHQRSGTW